MSAYPLPAAGCECATCKWLRDAGMTETGPRTYQGASNVLNAPRCGGCGEFFFQGIPVDHVCKTTTGGPPQFTKGSR